MRPLRRSSPAPWIAPASLRFSNTGPAGSFQHVFGTTQPRTEACLALLEDEVSGRPLTNDELAAAAAIRKRVSVVYRGAAPHLLDHIGHYCSYCELPLQDPAQVEHALPKAQYPAFSLDWSNFLPACIGCNSRKSDQPLRAAVAAGLPAQPPPQPADFRATIRTAMFRWPDLDMTYGHFGVRLDWHDGAAWRPLDRAVSVDVRTERVGQSVVEGTILADIGAMSLTAVPVSAVVFDATPGGDQRTQQMINLCELGRRTVPNDSADRRTYFRSIAWLRAVRHLAPVAAAPTSTLPQEISALIEATGFFWVWLTVAGLMSADLLRLVVGAAPSILPGTDPARLP
jgi:5-methylcytosine-specific restriction endonuclease McrA